MNKNEVDQMLAEMRRDAGLVKEDIDRMLMDRMLDDVSRPVIKDSGERRQFASGAVRDIQEGKGRCDLLPLDVVGEYMPNPIIADIGKFMESNNATFLWHSLELFQRDAFQLGEVEHHQRMANAMLEVSKHFEEGAKKYGDNNWRKGIPVRCYIDSGVRHYLKWLRGDRDEPHDRAFCWNMICAIWTCKHKPELNDYRPGVGE